MSFDVRPPLPQLQAPPPQRSYDDAVLVSATYLNQLSRRAPSPSQGAVISPQPASAPLSALPTRTASARSAVQPLPNSDQADEMPTTHKPVSYTTLTVLPANGNAPTTPDTPSKATSPHTAAHALPTRRTCSAVCTSILHYLISPSFLLRLFLFCLLASTITLAIVFWQWVETAFIDALTYIQNLGFVDGAIVLVIANIIGAICFMPCVPFTLGAGFLFGLMWGSIIILIATNIASVVAFLISRYFARGCIERRLGGRYSKFRLIDAAIKQDGFKIVALVRSSPLHPYGICNYLFGITSVTFPSYVLANVIAMTPGTVLEVWTGTSIHQLSDIISGNANQTAEHQIVFWAALLVTFIVTIIITLWLRSKLQYQMAKYDLDGENDVSHDITDGNIELGQLNDSLENAASPMRSTAHTRQRSATPSLKQQQAFMLRGLSSETIRSSTQMTNRAHGIESHSAGYRPNLADPSVDDELPSSLSTLPSTSTIHETPIKQYPESTFTSATNSPINVSMHTPQDYTTQPPSLQTTPTANSSLLSRQFNSANDNR